MSSEARPAVRIRGLCHSFGAGPNARQVLSGLDLDVAPGEFMMLMGPSGCGKTTVLTLIGGLRAVQAGSLRTLGAEMRGADQTARIALRRRIGFIFQAHNLHHSLTAIENVRMALEVHGPDRLQSWQADCRAVLDAVGLADRAGSYPTELSTGQKQRVAVARALVARPRLILADEPTAALDRRSGQQVMQMLHGLAREQGTAVLIVTHDNRILGFADRVVEMDDGRIVAMPSFQSSALSVAER